jgi:hypothetical protein
MTGAEYGIDKYFLDQGESVFIIICSDIWQ